MASWGKKDNDLCNKLQKIKNHLPALSLQAKTIQHGEKRNCFPKSKTAVNKISMLDPRAYIIYFVSFSFYSIKFTSRINNYDIFASF